MPDPRVAHYWDVERELGRWFPQQEEYKRLTFGPLAWDIFFLYGPEAACNDVPKPLVASGRTVLNKRGDLERDLLQLLSND